MVHDPVLRRSTCSRHGRWLLLGAISIAACADRSAGPTREEDEAPSEGSSEEGPEEGDEGEGREPQEPETTSERDAGGAQPGAAAADAHADPVSEAGMTDVLDATASGERDTGSDAASGSQSAADAGWDLFEPCGPNSVVRDALLCRDSGCAGDSCATSDAGSVLLPLPECAPGLYDTCSERQTRRCAANFRWEPPTQCPNACVDHRGCTECTPGETRCTVGEDASRGERCDAQGTWVANGSCGPVCTPGQVGPCRGSSARVCNIVGEWSTSACGQACVDGIGCTVCQPGRAECDPGGRKVCNASGAWDLPVACEDQACVLGECTGVCRPGATDTCSGGSERRCDATGQWSSSPCPAACVDRFGCSDGTCGANGQTCCTTPGRLACMPGLACAGYDVTEYNPSCPSCPPRRYHREVCEPCGGQAQLACPLPARCSLGFEARRECAAGYTTDPFGGCSCLGGSVTRCRAPDDPRFGC